MPSDKLIRRFNFRIYPTAAQEQQAAVTQDACRFVWNTLLTYRSLQYRICGRSVSKADCDRYITTLRAVFPWLKAADSMALQETSKDLDTAFRNFFEGRAGYPVYKSAKRQADGSCRCAWNRISCQRYSRMPVGLLALTSASSQACHICGHRYPKTKDLSVREWTCPVCGAHHDRDVNAAVNIKQKALSMLTAPA